MYRNITCVYCLILYSNRLKIVNIPFFYRQMPTAGVLQNHKPFEETVPGVEEKGYVGRRVIVNNDIATIKWHGVIEEGLGEWFGVEWDDPSRGRHDGSFKGRRYFTTRHPMGGSFVRPAKVSFGVSLKDAIDKRYARQIEEVFALQGDDLLIGGKTKRIELIGVDRIALETQRFDRLKSLYLHGQKISYHTPGIGKEFPKVREINIGMSLLSTWKEVGTLCSEFPLLTILNLSDNRLALPSESEEDFLRNAFSNITYLVMVRLDHDWTEIRRILRWFPRLKHLCVAYNRIESIDSLPEPMASELLYLDLGINPLKNWHCLEGLSKSAINLETLLLTDCSLSYIEFPDDRNPTEWFPKLKLLGLCGNRINSWHSIDEINRLASIEDVVVTDNPVINSFDRETSRQMVIAKVGRLTSLNRNEIEADERRGAEIDYLKRFGKDWAASYANSEPPSGPNVPPPPAGCDFLRDHPRYMDLVARYGASEKSEYTVKSQALKDGLLCVHVIAPDNGNKDIGIKKFPGKMTVRHLKTALQRQLKAPASANLRVWYKTEKLPDNEYELDIDTREMKFYTIESGDTLLVRWS